MSKYFKVSGYWKDDLSEFSNLIVKEFDEVDEKEDLIFFYGLGEEELENSNEDDALQFVITDYVEVDLHGEEVPSISVEQAKKVLNDNGYQTANLWRIEDVIDNYDCDRDDAMYILEEALTNDATMAQIWFAIDFHAEEEGLTKK